jgi:hypothetical protein
MLFRLPKGPYTELYLAEINSSKLEPSAIIGSVGSGDGQFRHPQVLATDSIGNIYVTVRDDTEVQKFTNNGKFITPMALGRVNFHCWKKLIWIQRVTVWVLLSESYKSKPAKEYSKSGIAVPNTLKVD